MCENFLQQDSCKDLNFMSKYNYQSRKCLRKTKYNRHFLYMSDKTCMELYLKTKREDLFFISPGNRSHNLAPKFETLSIPYSVVCMFFRAK